MKFSIHQSVFLITVLISTLIADGVLSQNSSEIGEQVNSGSKHFNLYKLADGVYATIHNDDGGYAICNGGIIDLGDRTVVVDAFITLVAARDLKAKAEAIFGRKVDMVVNTHAHSDHTRGNQVFAGESDIVTSAKMRELIAEWSPGTLENDKKESPKHLEEMNEKLKHAKTDFEKKEYTIWKSYYKGKIESFPELKTEKMIPNVTFDSVITLHGPKRSIKLINMGPGHTPSDLVVYLPEEKILFAGDLLFNQRHPYLGWHPNEWKDNLEKMNTMDIDVVVPGHGSLCGKDKFMELHAYITHLQTYVNEQAENGKTMEEIINSPIPPEYSNWHFQRFYGVNLDHVCKMSRKF